MNLRKKLIFAVVMAALVFSAVFVGVYVSDYYRADEIAIEAFSQSFSVNRIDSDGAVAFGEPNQDTAFIFYPGGKVEYTAYAPLIEAIASQGTFCVVVEMPFNLAVLDTNAAERVRAQYPDIESWYIGGHSLGGSMAASHIAANADKYEGLVLLGSYSTADLSESGLEVLSIYASEDRVMNREKYEQYRTNLPSDFGERIIEGGCHAYFGMYGEQDGDGTPTLTPAEQILITADYIHEFISGN